MPIDPALEHHLQKLLAVVDEGGARGGRLLDDAHRLSTRIEQFLRLELVTGKIDRTALQLACYALQLPPRHGKGLTPGRLGQLNLRERAEQAAELLFSAIGERAPLDLLERTARILREIPRRGATVNEARLLADAVNLDDFGAVGFILQAMQLSRVNEGIGQLLEGAAKRQQYGYWDARLKDGFHFDPVRQMARQRLANAKSIVKMLHDELGK